ncbi:MAG: bile acid:sodium symporter family protein [Pseudobdellovibrionaceae bacterium]
MNLQSLISIVFQISIFLTVMSFALNAKLKDVTDLWHQPGQLLRSLIAMNLIMPVFAGLLALIFNLDPALKIALVAISISPIPPFLPKKELQAGGNSSYTFGLFSTTAALSIFLIPLTMAIFDRIFQTPSRVPSVAIAQIVFLSVFAPLAVGITLNEWKPHWAQKIVKPVTQTGKILLLLCLVPILLTSFSSLLSLIGNGTLLAMLAFIVVALLSGHLLGGPKREDRMVLALSTASRHPGVAIAISQLSYPDQTLAPVAVLLYLLVNALATIPYTKKIGAPKKMKESYV